MRRRYITGMVLAIVSLVALASCSVVPQGGAPYQPPYQRGSSGMMGSGMMGGGMMGPGMMGGGYGGYNPNATPLTFEQVADVVRRYLTTYGGNLVLTEVMDFAWDFYAEVEEKDTGIHAMELLIDKYTGQVSPEMGPNMMWNNKYGMMASGYGQPTARMPVTAEQAKVIAQRYLDTNLPGFTVAEADTFYGYNTLHTLRNGQVEGMLSVNGYTGAIWYHTWHGSFLGMMGFE